MLHQKRQIVCRKFIPALVEVLASVVAQLLANVLADRFEVVLSLAAPMHFGMRGHQDIAILTEQREVPVRVGRAFIRRDDLSGL